MMSRQEENALPACTTHATSFPWPVLLGVTVGAAPAACPASASATVPAAPAASAVRAMSRFMLLSPLGSLMYGGRRFAMSRRNDAYDRGTVAMSFC